MAHQAQMDFFKRVQGKFPGSFIGKTVLDVGSLDICGCARGLFNGGTYIGLDIGLGKNVDVVCIAHEYDAPDNTFDTIITGEAEEHDQFYPKTLANIVRMLKPGGLFVMSCATTGRPEHGTKRTTDFASPFTSEIEGWSNYYKNLTEADIRACIDMEATFSEFAFEISGVDLYLWAVKKK
jgi:SAM-dependent methyltransferase